MAVSLLEFPVDTNLLALVIPLDSLGGLAGTSPGTWPEHLRVGGGWPKEWGIALSMF